MTLDYVAGIVDGEGTISLHPYKTYYKGRGYMPYISVANTDRRLLDAMAEFFKELGVSSSFCTKPARKANHKVSYAISVRGAKAIRLAKLLTGRLIIKKEQCAILAEEYEACTPKNGQYTPEQRKDKELLIDRFHVLNMRGVPV